MKPPFMNGKYRKQMESDVQGCVVPLSTAPLKFHDSPFHVTHDKDIADKMAIDVDMLIAENESLRNQNTALDEALAELEDSLGQMIEDAIKAHDEKNLLIRTQQ